MSHCSVTFNPSSQGKRNVCIHWGLMFFLMTRDLRFSPSKFRNAHGSDEPPDESKFLSITGRFLPLNKHTSNSLASFARFSSVSGSVNSSGNSSTLCGE